MTLENFQGTHTLGAFARSSLR